MNWRVDPLSFFSIGLINSTVLATFGPTSCLEMESAEANIPFLGIGEVIGGELLLFINILDTHLDV